MVAVAGMNDSLVTDDLSGHGSGRKIKPMMGHGFFNEHILCSWAWFWIGKSQWVRAHCHLYHGATTCYSRQVKITLVLGLCLLIVLQ